MAFNPNNPSLGLSAFSSYSGYTDVVSKKFVTSTNVKTGGTNIGDVAVSAIDDPTYLGFTLYFDPLSPLFNLDKTVGSDTAYSYLLGTFDSPVRANYLKAFVDTLFSINKNFSYYFQTVEGLDRLWKVGSTFGEDPYIGGDEAIIKIGCLEALDMKITAMMDLYRAAIYDFENRRIVVPVNLRQFDVTIYVHEIRRFKTAAEKIVALGMSDTMLPDPNNFSLIAPSLRASVEAGATKQEFKDTAKFVNENTAQISFNLQFCEFIPEESSAVFENVSNLAGEIASQKIAWKYETLTEKGSFPSLSFDISDSAANGLGGSNAPDGNAAKWMQAAKNFANVMATSALASASTGLAAGINKTAFGNSQNLVGSSSSQLASIAATVQSVDGVLRLGEIAAKNAARNLINKGILSLTNPLGSAPPPGPPLETYNAFK
jgi:hypothetical protein